MAQIKAHEFDSLIKRQELPYRAFLVYGPDYGLVSERAKSLSGSVGVDLQDEFAVVRLDISDITADPARLADEVGAIGLFGGKRLIWIKGAGNDKKFVDALKAVIDTLSNDVCVLIEGVDLKKSSSLRKTFEGAKLGLAIPCYADDGRALQSLIDQELSHANMRMTMDARHVLMSFLGGDRLASRGELQKLILYCHGQDEVTEDDVMAAIGDASAISVDETVDAILTGDINRLDQSYNKIIASKTPIFLILRGCLVQLQQLDLMRSEMETNRKRASQVMAEMGRFIHFKRKPAFEKALNKWNSVKLRKEMDRIGRAILETRQNNSLEEAIARQALIRVCLLSR